MRYFVSVLVLQSSRWERESWLLCFVFRMSRDCCMALPHYATSLPAVCDCSISWSYSLLWVNLRKKIMLPGGILKALLAAKFLFCHTLVNF